MTASDGRRPSTPNPALATLRDSQVAGDRDKAERAVRAAIALMGGAVGMSGREDRPGQKGVARGSSMPRYSFDVLNGEALNRDVDGIDLPSVRHVWQVAVTMVDDIAAAEHGPRLSDSVSAIVRDASDIVVYRSGRHGRLSVLETCSALAGLRTSASHADRTRGA